MNHTDFRHLLVTRFLSEKAALELKQKTCSSTLISFIGDSDCASLLEVSLIYPMSLTKRMYQLLQAKATGTFSVSSKKRLLQR